MTTVMNMAENGIRVLEARHMISIVLYLSENDGCIKTDLYRDVSNNPRMPSKLDELESSGLIVQEQSPDSNAVRLRLTDTGRRVSALLSEADGLMTT